MMQLIGRFSLRARLRGDVSQLADAALKKSRSEANGDLLSMPIHMAERPFLVLVPGEHVQPNGRLFS